MNAADVPKYVFKSQAWSLLPVIQKYYESEGGKRHWCGVMEKGQAMEPAPQLVEKVRPMYQMLLSDCNIGRGAEGSNGQNCF